MLEELLGLVRSLSRSSESEPVLQSQIHETLAAMQRSVQSIFKEELGHRLTGIVWSTSSDGLIGDLYFKDLKGKDKMRSFEFRFPTSEEVIRQWLKVLLGEKPKAVSDLPPA